MFLFSNSEPSADTLGSFSQLHWPDILENTPSWLLLPEAHLRPPLGGGGPWGPVWKPTTLMNNPIQSGVASFINTGLITETIRSLYIQSINKRVKPKGRPTTCCLCFSLPTRTLIISFFWLLSFPSPHTDLSPPSVASRRVCLAPRWCFFISSSLMSCSPSICEGLSSFSAAATCCKLFSLIVKSHNSVMAAGECKRGKHRSRRLGRIREREASCSGN